MIVLVGFMGAGKSSVGRVLAARLDLPFVDVDEEIERTRGVSVAQIFETEGEAGFRALERAQVRVTLGGDSAVVAVGGGAIESDENRRLLEGATVVYLEVDVAEALARIDDSSTRPMLGADDPPALLDRRRPLYEAVADVTVTSVGKSLDEVVDEIVACLPAGEPSPR